MSTMRSRVSSLIRVSVAGSIKNRLAKNHTNHLLRIG